MPKYLRDVGFYMPPSEGDEAKKWALSTNFLESLYWDSLPPVITNGVSKVVVRPSRTAVVEPLKLLCNSPKVLEISKMFDFEVYWRSGKDRRKVVALEFLQEGLLDVAQVEGWDAAGFKRAYETVIVKKYVNYLPWGKAILSPEKRYRAQVWCDYDSDRADIYVAFSDLKTILGRKYVTTVQPGDVWIRKTAETLMWSSADNVKVTSYDASMTWEVSVF